MSSRVGASPIPDYHEPAFERAGPPATPGKSAAVILMTCADGRVACPPAPKNGAIRMTTFSQRCKARVIVGRMLHTEVVPFPVRDLLYAATGEMLYFNVIPRPGVHRREVVQA